MKMDVIIKYWGKGCCGKNNGEFHWAYYVFEDEAEKQYWTEEHKDEINRAYWRHYGFMSMPCHYCGVYSPLRCGDMFSSGRDYSEKACKKEDIINYRPGSALPDTLAYYTENGWSYIYFKETLSDSLDGQETFRLKSDPDKICP